MSKDATTPEVLERLFAVIAGRKDGDAAASYTASLLAGGTPRIAKKLGEEAIETAVAALSQGRAEVVAESADLLYHLLVLWADAGVDPAEVWDELARREGISGIEEKESRKP